MMNCPWEDNIKDTEKDILNNLNKKKRKKQYTVDDPYYNLINGLTNEIEKSANKTFKKTVYETQNELTTCERLVHVTSLYKFIHFFQMYNK